MLRTESETAQASLEGQCRELEHRLQEAQSLSEENAASVRSGLEEERDSIAQELEALRARDKQEAADASSRWRIREAELTALVEEKASAVAGMEAQCDDLHEQLMAAHRRSEEDGARE